MKTCSKCKESKELELFAKNNKRADGRQVWCKACSYSDRTAWGLSNKDKVKVNRLWAQYRMRPSDLENLLKECNNSCNICERSFEHVAMHIDHNHECCPGLMTCGNCVRGLLCRDCNLALGRYEYLLKQKSFTTYINDKTDINMVQ